MSITIVEIRKMGLETLHHILQSSAHAITKGWETIFLIFLSLGMTCASTPRGATRNGVTSPPGMSITVDIGAIVGKTG